MKKITKTRTTKIGGKITTNREKRVILTHANRLIRIIMVVNWEKCRQMMHTMCSAAFERYVVACVLARIRNVKSLINWKWKGRKEPNGNEIDTKGRSHHCKTYRNMCVVNQHFDKHRRKSQHLLLILLRIILRLGSRENKKTREELNR